MKAVVEFLRQLHAHNERAWFEAHRAEWLQLQERVRSFAEGLIEGIASFDPSVEGLTAKDCTYRIYRDVRFSRDKSPYKTWQGIYVAPHGKKAGYAGYYFHLEGAAEEGLVGSHMLFSGLHMPHPTVLRSVREEILDNGAEFVGNIRRAEGFALDESQRLRRTPAGFPTDSPYDELSPVRRRFPRGRRPAGTHARRVPQDRAFRATAQSCRAVCLRRDDVIHKYV